MLKKIALVVVILLVAFFAFAATRPNTFRVERSATIKAPADKIYPHISDFHQWPAWSPYEQLDPNMKRTYGGAATGPGALYSWEGNSKVGAGQMELLQATQPSKVLIKLDFSKPMAGHDTAEFTLTPQADSTTTVTWAMYGPSPYIAKVMGLMFNMDHMIGSSFEDGLAKLKATTEH